MKEEPDWDHLQTFLAVLKEGGLSQAARGLGLSQPSVGRHIDALESALGEPLFTRSRNGMSPTAAALRLAPHAEAMASAAAALRRAASADEAEIRGPVRLTAPEVMAQEVLPPMLTAFVEQHPGVELEVVSSNDALNLLTREADIAVRTVRPSQQALLARRAGTVRIGLFARRDYLERYGAPLTLEDLRTHRIIGYDSNPLILRRLAEAGVETGPDVFTFRCDLEAAQLAMLRSGYGIGGCQAPIAARDPDLVPVVSGAVGFDLEIWLAMHERLKTSLALRLLMEHLAAELGAYARSVSDSA
ncbi:MAG: LysR family transcriptional regulator [Minwuia sp.]|uniref:LysR family transcriptional regulator n=1 Tax=Minwuia sp. TaxID=2493630 RepID=UPI003A8796CD